MFIPQEVKKTIVKLGKAGYDAYIVGGCVRDILRGADPQDWDIATNANPEEIEEIFQKAGFKTFYENQFGTVTILTKSDEPTLKSIEITPYRIDEQYTDKRHPDTIKWARTIEEDLARRDFTINAMALQIQGVKTKNQNENLKFKIIDISEGQNDLKNKIIRAVGKPEKRFSEDALRMLRAVRFAVSLEGERMWQIESKTAQAVQKNACLLACISKERVRDELIKIISAANGAKGIELLRRLKLLKYSIPELEEGFAVWQNKHHIYQIYQHNLLSLNYACHHNFSTTVRLAALFHDIGKPKTKQGQGPDATFYNHEIVSAKMTERILTRLKFPKKILEKVVKIVRFHLFYYNVDEVSESSVRRLLRKVGQEDIEELLQVRYADRIGSGVPKAEPYKLRHLKYLFEKVSHDPISAKMLKVNGNDVMNTLNLPPCPRVGKILTCLLGQVLKDPSRNDRTLLGQGIIRLGQEMTEQELEKIFQQTKIEIEEIETKKDEMTKKKYWVT